MIYDVLEGLHEKFQNFFGESLSIVIWAFLLSLVCMLIYRFTSPQSRLKQLGQEVDRLKKQTRDSALMEKNPFQVVSRLLSVSIQRVVFSFLPALLASLPIILLWEFFTDHFGVNSDYLPFGPWWLRGWWTLFIASMVVFSFGIKVLFKIE